MVIKYYCISALDNFFYYTYTQKPPARRVPSTAALAASTPSQEAYLVPHCTQSLSPFLTPERTEMTDIVNDIETMSYFVFQSFNGFWQGTLPAAPILTIDFAADPNFLFSYD